MVEIEIFETVLLLFLDEKKPVSVNRDGFLNSLLAKALGLITSGALLSTPERLAQLFIALGFADTGISQQTSIQASQLMAAGDSALPQHQVGQKAQRSRSLSSLSVGLEQVGTEGTFHGVHPSACGGAE